MTELRYVGGLPSITLVFGSTGRSLSVLRGETLELLPNEAAALDERTDFIPADAPLPVPEKPGPRRKLPTPDPADPISSEEE